MKNLLLVFTIMCVAYNAHAQGAELLPPDFLMDSSNSNPKFRDSLNYECSLTDGQYTKYGNFVCYQKKPIIVSQALLGEDNIMKLKHELATTGEADLNKGEGVTKDIMLQGKQPLAYGYNAWKMNPWDPQQRGISTTASIFTERKENLNEENRYFFYYDDNLGKNIRMAYYLDAAASTNEVTDSKGANSAKAMSRSTSTEIGVSAGVEGVASGSANIDFRKKVDEAVSSKSLYVTTKKDMLLGTWKVTDGAILSKEFIDALINLPSSFTSSNKGQFTSFFDKFGTHYAKETDFGAKDHTYHKYSASTVSKAVDKAVGWKIEASGSIKGAIDVGASVATQLESSHKQGYGSEKSQTFRKTTGTFGDKDVSNAVPIGVKLRPVSVMCRAFIADRSIWDAKEKALNDAFKYFNDEYLKTKYAKDDLFITPTDITDADPNKEREVYLRPTRITYHKKAEGGECEARYTVKVTEVGKSGESRKDVFGYTGSMDTGANITSFRNLSGGEMKLGKYKGQSKITIRFDAWEDDGCGGDWTFSTACSWDDDDEHEDASGTVTLNAKAKVSGTARNSYFEVEFEVYQK